jgi:sugar phosphate isomerase/epimerase
VQTHPRVSLSMLSHWNWTVEQDLAFFDQEGVEVIGLSLAKMRDGGGWERYVDRIRDGGYRVTNVVGLGPIAWSDPGRRAEGVAKTRDALDAAVAFGAECMILTTGPAGSLTWEDAADAYADTVGPVLEEYASSGTRITLEHTNGLRVDVGFLHSLRDAIDLARRLGVGVCMEINACWAERGLGATIVDGIDTIGIVQLSDFAVGTMSTPNRLVPGDGDIPIRRILGQLLDAGYTGVFDLEMIGPRIEEEGYASTSVRAVEYVGGLLTALGA